jgi:FO synthase
MTMEEVLRIAHQGARAGCKEVLFTLGDKPELRYASARRALDELGHATTLDYLGEVARRVLDETGLLPHLNPGVMSAAELAKLRAVSASMGIMLESDSDRLCQPGGVHFGSPDKQPSVRLAMIEAAGVARVPFTSGILIGIGETREERISALMALRASHERHGHLQEVIIQNFCPKPDTLMADHAPASLQEHLWTIAVARLIFAPEMTIQAPPNLSPGALAQLIGAGINDWGGVSPITPDHVNPEAPWPQLARLEAMTRACGKTLTERLTIFPAYARGLTEWTDSRVRTPVLRLADGEGYARSDDWCAGASVSAPDAEIVAITAPAVVTPSGVGPLVDRLMSGQRPGMDDIARLFQARGDDFTTVCRGADALRRSVHGERVSFVVNRNINYTNICSYRCQFCAFAKGRTTEDLRGKPYNLPLEEVAQRVREAWDRGATEVCMQGGIHPSFTGQTYLDICKAAKAAAPDIHVHAFSPLEVTHGAETLGISLAEFLAELKASGLATLPGTAAEILHDPVRRIICPDKLDTRAWLDVMRTAHGMGLRSTSTIMFGHVEGYRDWAVHLLALRDLQSETGGFTEFVPLPFVHMEAPMYRKGFARRGPTFREAILMHAVGRLVLHPVITNVQASWVKMGSGGVRACLDAGVNDLGGTLMNESISRAAGASHGQEMDAVAMRRLIASKGRIPVQRTTLYGLAPSTARFVAHGERHVSIPIAVISET